jgi:ferredoxin
VSWPPVLEGFLRAGEGAPVPAAPPCEGPGGLCGAACATACPRGVLHFRAGHPEAEAGCDGCGLCAAACPRGALRAPGVERRLRPRPGRRPANHWACSAAAPSSAEIVPCLGALRPERVVWMAHAAGGTLHLESGECARCPLGPASEKARRSLDAVGRLLREAAGREVLVLGPPPEARDGSEALDRRAFFRSVAGSDGKGLPAEPAARGILETALKGLLGGRPAPEGLLSLLPSFHAPAVQEDRCSLCGSCALACPAGALSLEETGNGLRLLLAPGVCTGCGACAAPCVPGALHLELLPRAEGTQTLAEGPAGLCAECGRRTRRPSRGPVLCPACLHLRRRRASSPFSGYALRA